MVIIPRTCVDLPANRVTSCSLFYQAPAACVLAGQSRPAQTDACNTSGAGGFATITANRMTAGAVATSLPAMCLSKKGLKGLTGVVTYINYADGYYRLNGDGSDGLPTSGVMVRLNDPDGRHTIQQGLGCAGGPNCSLPSALHAGRGQLHPTLFATGYPLCIPGTATRTFTDTIGPRRQPPTLPPMAVAMPFARRPIAPSAALNRQNSTCSRPS